MFPVPRTRVARIQSNKTNATIQCCGIETMTYAPFSVRAPPPARPPGGPPEPPREATRAQSAAPLGWMAWARAALEPEGRSGGRTNHNPLLRMQAELFNAF